MRFKIDFPERISVYSVWLRVFQKMEPKDCFPVVLVSFLLGLARVAGVPSWGRGRAQDEEKKESETWAERADTSKKKNRKTVPNLLYFVVDVLLQRLCYNAYIYIGGSTAMGPRFPFPQQGSEVQSPAKKASV